MNIKAYQVIRSNRSKYAFEFTSRGIKNVTKIVELKETNERNIYNLSLGDILGGKVYFNNVTNNKDTDTVMQTIGDIVIMFTSAIKERMGFVMGNTPARTRLYQMYLSNNLEKVQEIFLVAGLKNDGTGYELFEKGKNYNGFLVRRK